jgi:hypothetical protein
LHLSQCWCCTVLEGAYNRNADSGRE